MLLIHILAQAAAAVAAPTEGVVSYPAAFFADQQPANAWEMVQRAPGFRPDVGQAVRGFEGGGGNILVDGQRPVSKTDALDEILKRIPAGQVERVDIVRGGAPGIDMQGRSVIANVIRRPGAGFQGLLAGSNMHTYDGRDLPGLRAEMAGQDLGGRKWEAAARYSSSLDDGLSEGPGTWLGPTGEVIRRSNLDGDGDGAQYAITGAIEQPILGGRARINLRTFGDKFKVDEDETVTFPSAGLDTRDELYRTLEDELGGRFERGFGARTNLEVLGLLQTRDRETTTWLARSGSASVFALDRETREIIGRALLKHQASPALALEAGGEGAFNRLDSLTSLMADGRVQALPAANVRVEEARGQAFGRATWRPDPAWTLEGALRFEASDIASSGDVILSKTLYFAKPRLAASWAPRAGSQLRLRVEREVGQLKFDDFVAVANPGAVGVTVGNPDLEPEQAWVGEAALEQRFWGNGVAILTLRHSRLTDAIDRGPVRAEHLDPATGQQVVEVFDRPTNIGAGTSDHAIFELSLPLGRFGLKGGQLKGDVTWRRTRVTDPTTGERREISGVRPIAWNAALTQDLPAWNTSWGVDVFGAWRERYYRYNSIDTVKLKTYPRPWVEWRVRPDLAIRAELGNITSRGFRRTTQIYAGPRDLHPTPARTEDRDYQFGRTYVLRVRKSFGG